ncbi:type II toxin-antitoxin system MqsR family toxin [Hoeflea ulvae]|uniref:Type II toxin-antitoxin system MqsR family toxin n=1 Tax=Hoeflea ulvae TaxID=2983764 RepID=A0ABT3YHX3_9HYPH|nr:type II toxin-antitoxin system MqsR family toxin [Hoeflea ulvae]MCY0095486.1 type II toxin-antitoxin system MqsR family toxin [Hoeflea ulvae]
MTEKRRPTYDLDAIKSCFSTPRRLKATGSAIRSAAALGFGSVEIVLTIQSMERRHFQKSMTSHANHRIWQDVHHVPSDAGELYVKFTADVVSEFLLLSFKEKDNG